MRLTKFHLIIAFLIAGVLIAAVFIASQKNKSQFKEIKIGNAVINAEIADTPSKQIKGLSGKNELKENQGMLFVYSKPGFYSIWMKDMKFPIDIVWVDENKKIIGVENEVRPESYPKSFEPSGLAKYALEINSGFVKKYGIGVGKTMDF